MSSVCTLLRRPWWSDQIKPRDIGKSALSALSGDVSACLHRHSKLILPNYVLDLVNFTCMKEVSKCIISSKTGDTDQKAMRELRHLHFCNSN